MISFECDYQEGCIPEILQRLSKNNYLQMVGYGEDQSCLHAAELIRAECGAHDSSVHFISGGTLTNLTVISSALKSYQGVICAQSGHIATHETGAIECTGHKVITLPCRDGKLSADDVEEIVKAHSCDFAREHIVMPAMVYISQSTETGSVYTLKELTALSKVCKKYGLIFYIDGARLLAALFSKGCDFTLRDIAGLCDVFYIGGTKAGALLGEAVVINDKELDKCFRFYMKQHGALMAKGFILGAQFEGLFENGAYKKYAERAVAFADKIRAALLAKGFVLDGECADTQTYVTMTEQQYDALSSSFRFGCESKKQGLVNFRICTSWATEEGAVSELIKAIESL